MPTAASTSLEAQTLQRLRRPPGTLDTLRDRVLVGLVYSRAWAALEALVCRGSKAPLRPFLEIGDVPGLDSLRPNFEAIQREALAVMATREVPSFAELEPGQARIGGDRNWKVFALHAFGPVESNLARCPETARVLAGIPGVVSASFSILQGPKRVPVHRGIFRGLIRVHLGLVLPPGDGPCSITVGGETRSWAEGELLVFDDTYPHGVEQGRVGERVILLIDIERPIRAPYRWLNRAMIRAGGRSKFARQIRDRVRRGRRA